MKFKDLENSDRLLYRYVAGSTLYHCNEADSDIDTKGLFIATQDELFGLGFDKSFRDKWGNDLKLYDTQVNDDRNDNVLYEVGKYMGMLLSSNANVLESLFVPDEMMIVRPHECLGELFANRDKFVTKDCFKPFIEYAVQQIAKARGLNKKIVNPITERKGILDFTYTFFNQGSTKITNWLEYRGLDQKYCGLVNIPNMKDVYGVYYDWGRFFEDNEIQLTKLEMGLGLIECRNTAVIVKRLNECTDEKEKGLLEKELGESYLANMVEFIVKFYNLEDKFGDTGHTIEALRAWYKNQKPIGYSGMVGENSQALRLSSVSKGEKPICYVSYNKDGYIKHCVDYKNYKDWEKFRNPKRYESNLNKNYDSKNMYHSVRLMRMGKEIANGDGIILDRRVAGDRELLMNIRHHKFEYDELMEIVSSEEQELSDAIAKSKLPEHIDVSLVNDILIGIRKKFYQSV